MTKVSSRGGDNRLTARGLQKNKKKSIPSRGTGGEVRNQKRHANYTLGWVKNCNIVRRKGVLKEGEGAKVEKNSSGSVEKERR